MLDMEWMKQRFESTRKGTADRADSDTDTHQLNRLHSRRVYCRPKIGDRPSMQTRTGCEGASIPTFAHI